MADTDFNIIQPVDNIHNVQGLTPAKRRQQRKRQQHAPAEHQEEPEEQGPDDSKDQQTPDTDGGSHSIDYCA